MGVLSVCSFSPYDVYFVNKSRNTIFHFYDSRGLDIVSNSKEAIKELYLKRNEWILNYDRERIHLNYCVEQR